MDGILLCHKAEISRRAENKSLLGACNLARYAINDAKLKTLGWVPQRQWYLRVCVCAAYVCAYLCGVSPFASTILPDA